MRPQGENSCYLPAEKAEQGKTKTRSNAFGNRLNAFESRLNVFGFSSYSLFSSGRSHICEHRPKSLAMIAPNSVVQQNRQLSPELKGRAKIFHSQKGLGWLQDWFY